LRGFCVFRIFFQVLRQRLLETIATDLRKSVSRKTVLNVLGTIFTILDYAGRCGIRAPQVKFKDLELGTDAGGVTAPFLTHEQATRIVVAAREPYKTIFDVAWNTGMRVGEILALNRADLNFERKTIRVDNHRMTERVKSDNPRQGTLWRRSQCHRRLRQRCGITSSITGRKIC
jgi:integrase